MAARRCSWCGRNHPLGTLRCPDCGSDTWHVDGDPDTAATIAPAITDGDPVQAWRLRQLLEAGYPYDDACDLAAQDDVDLHQAVELVERGCPAGLAARILL